jgi:hypothetical protein
MACRRYHELVGAAGLASSPHAELEQDQELELSPAPHTLEQLEQMPPHAAAARCSGDPSARSGMPSPSTKIRQ